MVLADLHPQDERAILGCGLWNQTKVYEVDLTNGASRVLFDHPTARAR